jgi:hypothetical protein
MILNAIERGVPEERIAAVFHVNPDNIRRKRRLLDGICAEAASLLEDKHVPMNSFDALRKMLPERQVEAAELMVAMNNFTASYAKTLLAATPESQLVPGKRARTPNGVTEEQLNLMRRESASLDRDFRLIEETYGADHLDLVLAKGYLARLVENPRVAKYLREHHRRSLWNLSGSLNDRQRQPDFGRRALSAWGPGPFKRGDRRRRRTVGRIECGGGDGGEPARSPPWLAIILPAQWRFLHPPLPRGHVSVGPAVLVSVACPPLPVTRHNADQGPSFLLARPTFANVTRSAGRCPWRT